jgi:hypothetical protein
LQRIRENLHKKKTEGQRQKKGDILNFAERGGELVQLVFLVYLNLLNKKNQIDETNKINCPGLGAGTSSFAR